MKLTEPLILKLYQIVKPRKTKQIVSKEYWKSQHEKHKEKRNAMRRKYYHDHKVLKRGKK